MVDLLVGELARRGRHRLVEPGALRRAFGLRPWPSVEVLEELRSAG